MGTNYYWHSGKDKCDKCGHSPGRPLHIGKSSAGWCFSLHVTRPGDNYPEDDGAGTTLPCDLDGWRTLFAMPGSHIENECGDIETVEDMLDIILNRSHPLTGWRPDAAWYASNHASPGPHNLARHADPQHGHPGPEYETWDYCYGEFR